MELSGDELKSLISDVRTLKVQIKGDQEIGVRGLRPWVEHLDGEMEQFKDVVKRVDFERLAKMDWDKLTKMLTQWERGQWVLYGLAIGLTLAQGGALVILLKIMAALGVSTP